MHYLVSTLSSGQYQGILYIKRHVRHINIFLYMDNPFIFQFKENDSHIKKTKYSVIFCPTLCFLHNVNSIMYIACCTRVKVSRRGPTLKRVTVFLLASAIQPVCKGIKIKRYYFNAHTYISS